MSFDSTFDLSLDDELDGFDPLADDGADEDDELEGGETAPISAAVDAAAGGAAAAGAVAAGATENAQVAHADERTAAERIDALFESMAPRRKVLLGILAYVSDGMKPVAEVNAEVDRLQEDNYSVYSAADLCKLLEGAGAIERVTAEGTPADEVETEPKTVVVDGIEYIEAAEPVEIFWQITEDGQAKLDSDKPVDRMRELFERDEKYAVIYKRILTLCAAEGGATTPDINSAVDDDPLVQKPRLYAPHFVDLLEKCDALEWRKAWYTTEVGRAGLEILADVEDAPAEGDAAGEPAATASAAETANTKEN